jgi:outer membrane protein OmpA-like peptidoglycan-associated protein
LPSQPAFKTFNFAPSKLFDKPDTAKLKNPKSLDEVGRFLEQNAFGLAVITASTGGKGEKDKNRELSQAQAMVVRDYLAKNFKLDDARVKTMGLGESEAAQASVEILIYAAAAQPPKGRPPGGGN